MNEETNKLTTALRDTIGRARSYSGVDVHEVFLDAESIISALAYLISPKMELETRYRTKIVEYMANGDSAAKAEAKAKAGTEYSEWRKLEQLYDLGNEQIMLLKKFKDGLEMERQNVKI